MLTAVPEMTWFARRWIESTAWIEAEEAAGRHRAEQADLPRAALLRHDDAPEAAHQHHALEADVDDAGALREEAAERAERERRRVLEGARRRGPSRRSRRPSGSACARSRSSTTKTAKTPRMICPRRVIRRRPRRWRRSARGGRCRPAGRRRMHRRALALGASDEPAHDQLAADEQDDRALDDARDAARELGAERARELAPAALQRGEQQRREDDADGGVAAEQRDGDAGEADVEHGHVRGGDRVVHAEHLDRAGEAGERPADRHRRDHRALDRDAAVARRLGVEADRAHLVAERRAVEHDVVDDGARRAPRRSRCGSAGRRPTCPGTARRS